MGRAAHLLRRHRRGVVVSRRAVQRQPTGSPAATGSYEHRRVVLWGVGGEGSVYWCHLIPPAGARSAIGTAHLARSRPRVPLGAAAGGHTAAPAQQRAGAGSSGPAYARETTTP